MPAKKTAKKTTAKATKPRKASSRRPPRKKKTAPPKVKQSSAVARSFASDPSWMFENLSPFDLPKIEDALNKSAWLFACTYRLAAAVSSIGFRIIDTRTGEEAKGTKAKALVRLLKRINAEETYQDWVEANVINLVLAGETYIEKVRNRLGEVAELWTWRPATVIPVPDKTGRRRIAGYLFKGDAGGSVRLAPEDVIPVRVYNPNSVLRGMSAIAPIWTDLQGDEAAARWNRSFMNKGARIGGILTPTEGDLGSDEENRLRHSLRIAHSGAENAGKMLLLPFGLKYDRDVSSAKDMDFLNLRKFSREIAAGIIGVPPLVIGNFDSANYANAREQLRAFWDYVGKPLLKKVFGGINEHLIHPEIDENLDLWVDMAQIDALVDSQTTRVQNVSTLVQGGIVTINEGRKELGLGPLPDGDKLLLPLNLSPVLPDAIEEEEPPAPPPPQAPPPAQEEGEAPPPEDEDKAKARRIARRAHALQLRRSEAKLALRVANYLEASRQRFVARLEESKDPEHALGSVVTESALAMRALAPALLEVIEDAGNLAMERLGLRKAADGNYRRKQDAPERLPELLEVLIGFDLNNPRVAAYMERVVLEHVRDITEVSVEAVKVALGEGLAAGESAGELAVRIGKLPVFSPKRAERVARTETIGAFNLGQSEAFRVAGTPRKSWLSTRDFRVRDSHQSVDNATAANPIPSEDRFLLSGERGTAELMYPGDPDAPAWAVVNCRCSLVPEDEEDKAYWIAHCGRELELIEKAGHNGHVETLREALTT